MSSEFLPQFYSAWGVSPEAQDTTTIRGLIGLLEQWSQGDLRVEDVLNPTIEMQRRLDDAARSTAQELEQKHQDEPVRGHNERILEGFEVCSEVLLEIHEAMNGGARDDVAELLDELKAAADHVTSARIALEDWMNSPEPLCPGCGSRGDGRSCSACQLDLLIPDADATETPSSRQVALGPEYMSVYRAYRAVLQGEKPLEPLQRALAHLASRVNEWSNLSASIDDQELNALLAELEGYLEGIGDGIESMRGAVITRRVRELNRGWQEIFNNAVSLQGALPQLGAAAGEPVPAAPSSNSGIDSVSISF